MTEKSPSQSVKSAVLHIGGMHCAGCVQTVEEALRRLDGVKTVAVNLALETALVHYIAGTLETSALLKAVEEAGYTAAVISGTDFRQLAGALDEQIAQARRRMRLSWFFTLPLMLGMLPGLMQGDAWHSALWISAVEIALSGLAVFYTGGMVLKNAWQSMRRRAPTMDALIALGALSAWLAAGLMFARPMHGMHGFAGIAGMIMAFHLTGRYLEIRARGRASQALRKLLQRTAKTARILRDGDEAEIESSALKPGDLMLVRAGEIVPTDGIISDGSSYLDEALATGESIPVYKTAGDSVLGGTINQNGLLHVRATRVGIDAFLGRMIKLMAEAQSIKTPVQQTADRLIRFFVPTVLWLALAAFCAHYFTDSFDAISHFARITLGFTSFPDKFAAALYAAIAVLVVACPCALGLATPIVLAVAAGLGTERGILLRRAEVLPQTAKLTTVVFDKTGTLTVGQPAVADFYVSDGFQREEALSWLAGVENSSTHPLAAAIAGYARAAGVAPAPMQNCQAVPGRGIRAEHAGHVIRVGGPAFMATEGIALEPPLAERIKIWQTKAKTVVLCAYDTRIAAAAAIADPLRPDSKTALAALRAAGLKPVLLTGDNAETARAIAIELGIETVTANVLPEEKTAFIRALQEKGEVVAIVGDGINDAPALAQADIGIAMGSAADVAMEAGDIVLTKNDLTALCSAIKLGQLAMAKVRQNLFWAFFYNLVMLPLAFAGLMHPMLAEIAMVCSSLTVTFNALHLRRQFADQSWR